MSDCEIPSPVLEAALKTSRGRGFPIILDPAPAEWLSDQLCPLVNFITPNAAETGQLTGIPADSVEGAVQAGKSFINRGIKTAYIKMKAGGCVTTNAEQTVLLRAMPVTVVDTTGASDAFAGALAVAILGGSDPLEAGRFAVAAYPPRLISTINRSY